MCCKGNRKDRKKSPQKRRKRAGNARRKHKLIKASTKNPDYTWNGKLWELKTPEGIKGIDGLVHTGLKQIAPNSGGLIVDAKGLSGSHEEIMRQILHRVQRSAHDSLDLMVIEQDKKLGFIDTRKSDALSFTKEG